MRYLWQLFDALYNFFIKGTLTSESLWVAASFTISVEKELFYVKFHAKFNDPFWKYQVLIQLQYNNVCKIHLDEPNGPTSIEIRIVEKKVHKGILHFSKCTVFLIWLWLKIVLVCKLISYYHLYSGLSSPGIFDKKHGCMIEISLTCVSCKGELLCTIFSLPILIKIIISHVSICLKIYFFPLQFSESEWCPLTYSPSNCHQMDQ